jgi:hypothetical protein
MDTSSSETEATDNTPGAMPENGADLATELTQQLREECLAMAEYAFHNGLPISRSAVMALRQMVGVQAIESRQAEAPTASDTRPAAGTV